MAKHYAHISDSFQEWLDDNDICFEEIVEDKGVECYREQEGQWHYYAYELEMPTFCLLVRCEEKEYACGDRSGSTDYLYKGSLKDAKQYIMKLEETTE
jgi:hypothetical protein